MTRMCTTVLCGCLRPARQVKAPGRSRKRGSLVVSRFKAGGADALAAEGFRLFGGHLGGAVENPGEQVQQLCAFAGGEGGQDASPGARMPGSSWSAVTRPTGVISIRMPRRRRGWGCGGSNRGVRSARPESLVITAWDVRLCAPAREGPGLHGRARSRGRGNTRAGLGPARR